MDYEQLLQSVRDFEAEASRGPTHAVTVIGDLATGKTLFWHRTEKTDPAEAVCLFGKPVGAAFGTWLEIWLVTDTRAMLFFGR